MFCFVRLSILAKQVQDYRSSNKTCFYFFVMTSQIYFFHLQKQTLLGAQTQSKKSKQSKLFNVNNNKPCDNRDKIMNDKSTVG